MWLIQLFLFQKNGETNTEKSQNFPFKKISENEIPKLQNFAPPKKLVSTYIKFMAEIYVKN
jgi:hypothetical protein